MKILLVYPPREGEVRELITAEFVNYDFFNFPPMGILAIAANVHPRHDLKVLDCLTRKMSIDDTVNYIVDENPDVLGISVVSRRLYPSNMVAEKIKKLLPDTKIVAGGPHINDFPMETMSLGNYDYALAGYCEFTFPQLVEFLDNPDNSSHSLEDIPGLYFMDKGKVHTNPPSDVPIVLDDYPYPKRELIELDDYYTASTHQSMTTLYTSRGCPYKCSFCDVQDKTYHYRSTKSIVDEFEYILSLGIKEIHIFDDTFNMGRKRVVDMCEEIIRRGVNVSWNARVRAHPFDREMLSLMKESGCNQLRCGVESLLPASLKNMKKKITLDHIKSFFSLANEAKIPTFGYFILGFPEEDEKYRQRFFDEMLELKPSYMFLSVLSPLARTPLYDSLLKTGVYKKDYWADFFKKPVKDFDLPLCRPKALQDELWAMLDESYKKFYLSPRFIVADLKRNASVKMLGLKAKLAFNLMFAKTGV
jgi:anaerobic magnesium-protoporphyrin IX monomethyl ester cyclase